MFKEQSSTIGGKGKNIDIEDLAKLGAKYLKSKKICLKIAKDVFDVVNSDLGKYIH